MSNQLLKLLRLHSKLPKLLKKQGSRVFALKAIHEAGQCSKEKYHLTPANTISHRYLAILFNQARRRVRICDNLLDIVNIANRSLVKQTSRMTSENVLLIKICIDGIQTLQVHELTFIPLKESKSMRRRHIFSLLDSEQCNRMVH